jgi:hypothetical protein
MIYEKPQLDPHENDGADETDCPPDGNSEHNRSNFLDPQRHSRRPRRIRGHMTIMSEILSVRSPKMGLYTPGMAVRFLVHVLGE